MNQLIFGDHLEILTNLKSESVDLIYLDILSFSTEKIENFFNFQHYSIYEIEYYIDWLKIYLIEMYRILKPTGSFFLHCNWHTNAYIKILILDKIFGENCFRGEIIWQRHKIDNEVNSNLAFLKDTIWYYSKSENITYHPVYSTYDNAYLGSFYRFKDENGYFSLGDLGKPDNNGYRYEYKGYPPPTNGWRCPIETMQQWDANGLIYFPKHKLQRLRFKRYLDESQGNLCGDVWIDIQQPEALFQRIIQMASNENDVLLIPFIDVDNSTTIVVADKLKRKWIGITQSVQAVKMTERQLREQHSAFLTHYFKK